MKRASMFSAVVVAALAIGTAGPASAAMQSGSAGANGQSGSSAGSGQPGTSGVGSGQSNPVGGQAGTSGAGSTGSIAGGGQAASDDASGSQSGSQARKDDRQEFIEKAAIANMAEIQLGQLAASRAEDARVKQFAQMMVDEHTQALDQLRSAAGGATLPSTLDNKHQKLHDKLSTLQGAEFDRAYMDAMVDAHKAAEKLLKKRVGKDQSARSDTTLEGQTAMAGSADAEGTGSTTSASGTTSAVGTSGSSSSSTPASVDQWAAMSLPKVQSHLQQARSLEDQVKQQSKAQQLQSEPSSSPRQ